MIAIGEVFLGLAVLLIIYGALYLFARWPMAKGINKIVINLKKDDKKISKLKL